MRVPLKSEQERSGGGGPSICVRSLFKKKNAEIFKVKFYSYSPFFLLIIMSVSNIKQTIKKNYNISPVNDWRAIAFTSPHKMTNVGYVKNIYLQPFNLSDLFFWVQFRRS